MSPAELINIVVPFVLLGIIMYFRNRANKFKMAWEREKDLFNVLKRHVEDEYNIGVHVDAYKSGVVQVETWSTKSDE